MTVIVSPHTAVRFVPLAPITLDNHTFLMLFFSIERTVFKISHCRKIHVAAGMIKQNRDEHG